MKGQWYKLEMQGRKVSFLHPERKEDCFGLFHQFIVKNDNLFAVIEDDMGFCILVGNEDFCFVDNACMDNCRTLIAEKDKSKRALERCNITL